MRKPHFSDDEFRTLIECYARSIVQREITDPEQLLYISHRMAWLADNLADKSRPPEQRRCEPQGRILSVPPDQDFQALEQIDGELIVTLTDGQRVALPLPLWRIQVERLPANDGKSVNAKVTAD